MHVINVFIDRLIEDIGLESRIFSYPTCCYSYTLTLTTTIDLLALHFLVRLIVVGVFVCLFARAATTPAVPSTSFATVTDSQQMVYRATIANCTTIIISTVTLFTATTPTNFQSACTVNHIMPVVRAYFSHCCCVIDLDIGGFKMGQGEAYLLQLGPKMPKRGALFHCIANLQLQLTVYVSNWTKSDF